MANPSLSLIVLRTCQLEAALSFYRALGFSFVEEKHGSGPTHYSTQAAQIVIEIYPGDSPQPLNRKGGGATMLGFTVESLDTMISKVQKLGGEIVNQPKDSLSGRRAVVLDPDGRAIELSEPKKV